MIKFLQGSEKLFSISSVSIFDAKVIDDQTKNKAAVLVVPQSRGIGKGFISVWGEELF